MTRWGYVFPKDASRWPQPGVKREGPRPCETVVGLVFKDSDEAFRFQQQEIDKQLDGWVKGEDGLRNPPRCVAWVVMSTPGASPW